MAEEKKGATFVMSGAAEGAGRRPIEFTTFVLGLASTTLIHLGEAPHPETGKSERDLTLAQETLDLLTLLREKTRGNLTPEEERIFANLLADLQLKFVEASKH